MDIEKIRSMSEENGIIPVISGALLEGESIEGNRIFRKRTLRTHSTSDEPPSKSSHDDKGSNNGPISPAFYSTTKSL